MEDREHIDVKVGVERPRGVAQRRPRLVVIGVAALEDGWLGDRFPAFRLRTTRHPDGVGGWEHLRLPRGTDTRLLPGLDGRRPSRIRDSVRLAFDVGADTVDLLLARGEHALPWGLANPALVELFEPVLQDLRGLPVLLPDALGPSPLVPGGGDWDARIGNAVLTGYLWAPVFAAHYQLGLVDLPSDGPPELLRRALGDLAGNDLAACTFEGRRSRMERHGWRSAAAAVAALLCTSRLPSDTLVGRRARLGAGRRFAGEDGRAVALGAPDPELVAPPQLLDGLVRLRLDADDTATCLSDPALRAPVGTWTAPMVRTAKLVHQRLVFTAEQFVFRPVTQEQALTLSHALHLAISDYERRGLLVGPNGGPSRVVAQAATDPAAPGLVANVTTWLRPWLRRIRVDVTVRSGQPPELRET